MSEKITFDEVLRIPADSDDLLLVMVERPISRDEALRIRKVWEEAAPDHRMLVLDGGMRVEQLSDEDLARLGLRRIDPCDD